jgi:hypothetical protein
MVPTRHCETCHKRPAEYCTDIPVLPTETATRMFRVPKGRDKYSLSRLTLQVMVDAANNRDWDHPVWKDARPLRAESVASFRELEPMMRQVLSWPEPRPLLPGARVGPVRLSVGPGRVPDIFTTSRTIIVSDAVIATLAANNVTGVEWYPVRIVRGKTNVGLYELIVTGKGQYTEARQHDIYRCPECLEWWTKGPSDQFVVEIADSVEVDMFHMPARGAVYLNERTKSLLCDPRFNVTVSIIDATLHIPKAL